MEFPIGEVDKSILFHVYFFYKPLIMLLLYRSSYRPVCPMLLPSTTPVQSCNLSPIKMYSFDPEKNKTNDAF